MHTARAFALSVLLCLATAAHAQLPETTLSVNGHKLTAEVADSDATRMQGLMYRRILPENRGMLFVFDNVALHAMWMMNTYIPLSVAFIDDRGVIINIEDMKPHTRDPHPAAKPARYALEMKLGWLKTRGIKAGAKMEGMELAPRAR